jgi:hypothetical protein
MKHEHTPLATRARVKTQDRGGNIKPERTSARVKTSGRGIVTEEARAPQGVSATIRPENTKARMTGDAQNAAVKTRMNPTVQKATRPTPSHTTKNPLK